MWHPTRRWLDWLRRRTWDDLLRVVGLSGVIYETVAAHANHPYLLAVFAAMLGLPYWRHRGPGSGGGWHLHVDLGGDEPQRGPSNNGTRSDGLPPSGSSPP